MCGPENQLLAGRPDWHKIFSEMITRVHRENPQGESIVVFYCGSPAVALDLKRLVTIAFTLYFCRRPSLAPRQN